MTNETEKLDVEIRRLEYDIDIVSHIVERLELLDRVGSRFENTKEALEYQKRHLKCLKIDLEHKKRTSASLEALTKDIINISDPNY